MMITQKISRRETEIIELISLGFTQAEIAGKLYLSTHTINTHVKNIHRKMNARNTPQMVAHAFERKLLQVHAEPLPSPAPVYAS